MKGTATPGALDEATAAALAGELIVLPTDTVYGIGTRPDRPTATGRIFAAKGRPRDLELPVLVPSREAAAEVAQLDELALRLADAFWPGGLTLVLPRAPASLTWDLGGTGGTVGVRVPHHPLALALLDATGPLAVSSANRSGEETPSTCDELLAVFGDAVSVYLCQDRPVEGVASTVVDLTGGQARILRAGALDPHTLELVLAG